MNHERFQLLPEEKTKIQLFFLWFMTWVVILLLIFIIPFETMPSYGRHITAIGAIAALVFALVKMWFAQQRMMQALRRRLKDPE